MHAQEAMVHVDSLGLCIMYEPNTITAPRTNGIIVGISYDFNNNNNNNNKMFYIAHFLK